MAWFSNVKENLVKNVTQVAGQAARKEASQIFDETTSRHYLDKKFLNIRDFYNFMKNKSGANTPTDFFYFAVNFYQYGESLADNNLSRKAYNDNFFAKYDEQLMRLRFGIQQIQFPGLGLKSVGESGIATGSATDNASTIYCSPS